MISIGIVSVRVLARIEQPRQNLHAPMLRRKRERAMPLLSIGAREQFARLGESP
jgi:hypothetical protein